MANSIYPKDWSELPYGKGLARGKGWIDIIITITITIIILYYYNGGCYYCQKRL